jgi:hypothetical protein
VGPDVGSWDEGEIRRMMNAGEVNIKEGIWMSRVEYSVLKEKMKGYEWMVLFCQWSLGEKD